MAGIQSPQKPQKPQKPQNALQGTHVPSQRPQVPSQRLQVPLQALQHQRFNRPPFLFQQANPPQELFPPRLLQSKAQLEPGRGVPSICDTLSHNQKPQASGSQLLLFCNISEKGVYELTYDLQKKGQGDVIIGGLLASFHSHCVKNNLPSITTPKDIAFSSNELLCGKQYSHREYLLTLS